MLAQTNLQLYRQLTEAGWDEEGLETVQRAYDLARELFAGCYRPNHKSFIAHLVGTASALAAWGEPPAMVAAGLLHSAYLYGEFGDGTRGVNRAKRRLLQERVGDAVADRVERYTRSDHLVLQHIGRDTAGAAEFSDRDVVVMRLADMCDECQDAGPRYAPVKPLALGLPADLEARGRLLELADERVGPIAVSMFTELFRLYDELQPPDSLVNPDTSFHGLRRRAHGYRRGRLLGLFERVYRRLRK